MREPIRSFSRERPVRVVQITDLHLRNRPEARLDWGLSRTFVRPETTLAEVLDEIAYGVPSVNLVLATGDLAQDPSPAVYERLARTLSTAACPVQCLPGNHDHDDLLQEILGRHSLTSRVVALGDWVVILLNSTHPGRDSGNLRREELDLLEQALRRHPASHVLVALHHHPVPVGSAWLDRIGLANAREFFEILDVYRQVRGVVFGHIHQDFVGHRNGVLMLGSPSTCVQFTPAAARLQIDELPPAYRWLELHRDGRIDTGIGYATAEIRRRA